MTTLRVQLLGAFRLASEEAASVNVNSARLQSFLAYLLLNRHAPQSRQRLAFLFWPDSNEAQARTNLRKQIYNLRKAWPGVDQFLELDDQWLQWHPASSFNLDVAQLEAALARADAAAERGEHATQQVALKQAVDAYEGPLLPDCYDDWILPERERLHQAVELALDKLIQLLTTERDYAAAITFAQRSLRHNPLQEKTYRQLMRLHALSGEPALVQQTYDQCKTTLKRELDVEPSPATRQVYESLQKQEGPATVSSRTHRTPLVGREPEWGQLMNAWRKARDGSPGFALIEGEAGIGKTRLIEELTEWASRQGIDVAAARCYAIERGLSYSPVVSWLRASSVRDFVSVLDDVWLTEIARLSPELLIEQPDLNAPPPLLAAWERQRLYEALARAVLAGNRPLLLVLEDIQWSDRETLEWLHFLLRFDTQARLLIVATMRSEEVGDDHPLLLLSLEMRRSGHLTEVTLGPLGAADTATLARYVAGRSLDPQITDALYQETEGNPLFIVEMVQAEQWETETYSVAPSVREPSGSALLPPRVQAVIESRLAQLSDRTRELASLAAVIGRSFSYDLLAAASDQDDETLVRGLDELRQRGIIREQSAKFSLERGLQRYDFSHDKIRAAAYASLGVARRRLLHCRVGELLEALYAENVEPVRMQLTFHFEMAGLLYKAFQYCTQAAEQAAAVHGHRDAERLYARAIELAERLNWPGVERTKLYAAHGRMLEHQGRFAEAIGVYERLREVARSREDKAMQAVAIGRLVACYIEPSDVHDLTQAERLIKAGMRLAREIGDHEQEAHLLWCEMMRETHYGQHEKARTAGEQCLAIARRHNLKRQQSLALHDLAVNLRLSGSLEVGTAYADEARALFREMDNLPLLVDNLNQQALIHYLHLEFQDALQCATEAYEISNRINNGWNVSYATWIKGMVYAARGEWHKSMIAWEESLRWGEEAGFVMALTTVRMLFGALLRDIGMVEQAREVHKEALAASEEMAAFMLAAAESQLALDAFAAANPEEGRRWLGQALAREPRGEIGTALVLRWPARAAVTGAEHDGEWLSALGVVDVARTEARERKLALHEIFLTYERGRCLRGMERDDEAESELLEALSMAKRAALRPLQWETRSALFQLYRSQGRPDEAEPQREAALEVVQALAENLFDRKQRDSFLATDAVRLLLPPVSG